MSRGWKKKCVKLLSLYWIEETSSLQAIFLGGLYKMLNHVFNIKKVKKKDQEKYGSFIYIILYRIVSTDVLYYVSLTNK